MNKLKTLQETYFREDINYKKVKKDFLDTQKIRSFEGRLYHGSEPDGLLEMLENGLEPYQHNELQFYMFSTSINPRMLSLNQETGLIFHPKLDRVLVMNDFYYDLLSSGTGREMSWDKEENEELIQKLENLGFKTRFGDYGIEDAQYEFEDKIIRPLNLDGIIIPGFDSDHPNAEAEIAIAEEGLPKLWNSLETIVIEGNYFEPEEIDEAIEYLKE